MAFYATNSVTAGAHRLWTHKSYKVSRKHNQSRKHNEFQANFWVRLFYMIGDTIAVEVCSVSVIQFINTIL